MTTPGAGVVKDDGTIGILADGSIAMFDADGLSCCCEPVREGLCGFTQLPTEECLYGPFNMPRMLPTFAWSREQVITPFWDDYTRIISEIQSKSGLFQSFTLSSGVNGIFFGFQYSSGTWYAIKDGSSVGGYGQTAISSPVGSLLKLVVSRQTQSSNPNIDWLLEMYADDSVVWQYSPLAYAFSPDGWCTTTAQLVSDPVVVSSFSDWCTSTEYIVP